MNMIATCLGEFGADTVSLRMFDEETSDLLPYATILNARRDGDETLGLIGAVYEWQDAPLIFLVDGDLVENNRQLHRMRRLLAMRGDAPYLGVVSPGRLEVYHVGLDNKQLGQTRVSLQTDDKAKFTTLARLGNARPNAAISQRGWISNVVLNLLTNSISELIETGEVSDEDAISLVGRALFTRFLADRNLLPDRMVTSIGAGDLFDNRGSAEATSKWLDATFNGDLLPLSGEIFSSLSEQSYHVLGGVLRKAPDQQLFLGWEEKWDNLDFAHIPVGVLSQAYELYLRNHAPARQRKQGGYYTPRPIADLMVRASIRALQHEDKCENAKVLDPAAGAGVFLLTAFRELVAERWRKEGRRPNTTALRSILYSQIVGFDIDEAALRFAALGLYLMSIELDPVPKPVDKLRFKNLRGNVLHRLTGDDDQEGAKLGSLGPLVGKEHKGKYDIVIGNPPWASGTKLPDWKLVQQTVRSIAAERGIKNQSPPLPNEVLDLPFIWRAMEWAKPGGQIAFALHARVLFQQGDGMVDARLAIFDALDVTSVINGVELRQTKVWPEISAPFCLLFARNHPPPAGAGFRFVNPRLEKTLNNAGSMRVDTVAAEIIPSFRIAEFPEILKVYFKGTKADLGILERIRERGHPTLEEFWREVIGTTDRQHLYGSGKGYQRLIASSEIRKNGDGLPGVDASELNGLPVVSVNDLAHPLIDYGSLQRFAGQRMHRKRDRALFRGPMLIVHKSPPANRGRIQVSVADGDTLYNETFYGYSSTKHPYGKTLVRYLALLLGSKISLWQALLTSGEFGFEREVIEKVALDRLSFPDFRELSKRQLAYVENLFDDLSSGAKTWTDVDEWAAEIYNLNKRDLQVISDTLEFNLPYAENKANAQLPPSFPDIARFCEVLQNDLSPWAERFGTNVRVDHVSGIPGSPWEYVEIGTGLQSKKTKLRENDLCGLVQAADDAAATEIVINYAENGLFAGRLAQKRYWSETQAHLLAQRIIWSHIDILKGHVNA
ncbi:N-6 DNA methylase [Thalassobius sp. I31.1]|uniref:HsdM family class I SAM-dependent methyltransferase n=1 Tax=Thalassobius sp. I31.1 TaxID=2109912 RepID=UPI001E3EFA32|nr:N-6 DNA methylase [Thalassobius sp. I31.1]